MNQAGFVNEYADWDSLDCVTSADLAIGVGQDTIRRDAVAEEIYHFGGVLTYGNEGYGQLVADGFVDILQGLKGRAAVRAPGGPEEQQGISTSQQAQVYGPAAEVCEREIGSGPERSGGQGHRGRDAGEK